MSMYIFEGAALYDKQKKAGEGMVSSGWAVASLNEMGRGDLTGEEGGHVFEHRPGEGEG